MPRPRLTLLPLAHPEDIEGWTEDARRILVEALDQVARREIRGKSLLATKPGCPPLTECRALYLFPGATVRAIYRQVSQTEIEVVAVGERDGMAVYFLAGERLGRAPLPNVHHYEPDQEAA